MDYDFIDNMRYNSWTKLEPKWITNVKKNVEEAEKFSIKCFQLVWILAPYNERCEHTAIDRSKCTIYRV
jgi:hypothetical protein